ncbi:MAG: hypothetical protein RR405_06350, partial [Clostridia bacterium]
VLTKFNYSDVIGGIAGQSKSTISYCVNMGEVKGSNILGGIVGYKTGTTTYCYNTGTITKMHDGAPLVGGVVGHKDGGTVTNCWALYTGEKPTTNGV